MGSATPGRGPPSHTETHERRPTLPPREWGAYAIAEYLGIDLDADDTDQS